MDGVRKEAFASAASPLAYKLYANVALFRVLARQNRLAALAIQAGCSNPAIAASRDQI